VLPSGESASPTGKFAGTERDSRSYSGCAAVKEQALDVRPLRFGLIGTGARARLAQAPALASAPGIEFAAVWGIDYDAADRIAAMYKVASYRDFAALLRAVDGVAFAVPPSVQGRLAMRAASAGKHLLLEKPLTASGPAAEELSQLVEDAGVASVVFFTARFQADTRAWLAEIADLGFWLGGSAIWLGSALLPSSPFNTPWRRALGGLWDLAPHAVSMLWASLGPVRQVTADAGQGDITHLVLHHDSGASSVVTTTLEAPEAAASYELCVWGEHGQRFAPPQTSEPVPAIKVALSELAANARLGLAAHPCDVRFGRDITLVLADAQRQIDARRRLRTCDVSL
jgi:predicted dehydrogenase